MRLHLTVLILMIGFINACTHPKELSKEDLLKYINESKNGLVKEQEINGVKINLAYRPSSLLVQQELETGQKKDSLLLPQLQKKYGTQYYFMLSYSKHGKEVIRQLGSFGRYSDMLQVMAFQMHQYINVTTEKKDTVPLADYQFEQTYGMSAGNNLQREGTFAHLPKPIDLDRLMKAVTSCRRVT